MCEHYRPLTQSESLILEKLLSIDLPGIQVLRDQVAHARVRTIDECGSLEIKIDDSVPSRFRDGPLISARQSDADTEDEFGPHINILLFIKGGFLEELEIYKDDASPIQVSLDPGKLGELLIDTRRVGPEPEKSATAPRRTVKAGPR
ncbi:MAG: DUF6984 family protein [Stellaceae bacterium]